MNRLKLTVVIASISLLLLAGAYIYSLWAADRKYNSDLPFDAAAAMMRDLLRYHEKRGSFPENLKQLEGAVWEKKSREFDSTGRTLKHRNYYYFYTRASNHRSTLWAIPIGELREEGSTWFLLVTPEGNRRWKGPAIPLKQVDEIGPAPSLNELGVLGLTEQPNVPAKLNGSKK